MGWVYPTNRESNSPRKEVYWLLYMLISNHGTKIIKKD